MELMLILVMLILFIGFLIKVILDLLDRNNLQADEIGKLNLTISRLKNRTY